MTSVSLLQCVLYICDFRLQKMWGVLLKEDYPQDQAIFAKGNLILEEDFCKIYSQGNAFQVQKKFTFVTSFVFGRYMASRSEIRSALCIQWLSG